MSAEDDIAALLLALHDGPSSATTSPTQALKPSPLPPTAGAAEAAPPRPASAPSPAPTPQPALAFPGSFVVQPANPPTTQPVASTSTIRRATSPSDNPSARYLSPSLPPPLAASTVRGSSAPYDSYYASRPSTPGEMGTSLPPFQSLELDGQSHPPPMGQGAASYSGASGAYHGQPSYYPPPPPSHHYGPQPSYGAGPSNSSYLSLPPRDPNIHPLLQQQSAPQMPHPRPPNSPGQSSDIEPAEEEEDLKPTVARPPPPPLTIIPEAVPAAAPAKKRKRASGVGKESRGKGKGKGKAASAAAAAVAETAGGTGAMGPLGAAIAVAGSAKGSHILDPDSGIIRCICESIEDDGYTIQCDHCFAWNHIVCLGIAPSAVPDIYICPVCSPRPVDVPAAKEAQRQWREKAARLATEELERELAARAREAAEASGAAASTVIDPSLGAPPTASAGAAGSSPSTTVGPPAPAPVEKPKPKRKTGHNQHTAARDAREREAAALLLQQQQQAANGGVPVDPAAASSNGPAPAPAPTPGPVSHKRKSNALLRDILSTSTSASTSQQQNPQTPRPRPTSIDISSRAGGGFSHAGSPAPSRSGTDDGLDDEGRLEAWMLEFVDVKECLVRDTKVRRALERLRVRWVAEIPAPPSPPPPSKVEPPPAEVKPSEHGPTEAPAEPAVVEDVPQAMDVDPAPTADLPTESEVPPPPDAAESAAPDFAMGAPPPDDPSSTAPPVASSPPPAPLPPPPPPVVAKPNPPPSPEWTGPKASFGPLDSAVPPVFLSGLTLAALAAPTSIKVLADSSAAPPQTFTASHPTITTSLLRPVYPRPSMYGLYADSPIRKGALIGEVLGEVLAGELYRNDPINQYRSLGVPKPSVRALGAPFDVVVDQRGFGNETRFARNGCHPNAVVRPIIFTKTTAAAADEQPKADEPTLLFGLFASREIRGREEISVAWDWDDEHIVHALQPILQAALKASSSSTSLPGLATYLQPKFAGVLTHLSSVFYTCACTSKKDCSLAQMARVAEGKPLLGLADKPANGGRSARRKRPDLGVLVGAFRGWRDEEKRRAAAAQEAIERIVAERAAVAALKKAEAIEAADHLTSDDLEMDDVDDHSIRISPDDVEMNGSGADDEDGNLSDASTLTEPISHFSSDAESDDDDDEPQRPSSPADPKTPQRSPSLSPPPLLRTPPVAKTKSGVRRRPNNRVESESPPSSPPPVQPVVASTPPPPPQPLRASDPDSPLSDVPDSSPVLSDAVGAWSSPPKLSLSLPSDLFAVDQVMSAPPVAEQAESAPAAPPLAPAVPAKEPTPPPPPKEPTPPPPKPPTPPPVKRMSLKDWAKRRKEAVPTPPVEVEEASASAFAAAPPESIPSTPINEPQALDWGRPTPSHQSSPTQPTAPSPSGRFAPNLMAPPPLPSALPSSPQPLQQQQQQQQQPAYPVAPRLPALPSFTRRTDPQQPSPLPSQPSPSVPGRPIDPAAVPRPPAQAPAANSHLSAMPHRPHAFPPPSLPTRPGPLGHGGRTPSPPPPAQPVTHPPSGMHPDRDLPPHPLGRRDQPDVDRFRDPESRDLNERRDRPDYGAGALASAAPPTPAPPPPPATVAHAMHTPTGHGLADGPRTAASPFPPHRPSFGPPPALAGMPPTRGGFGGPALRGGGRAGLPFAPPSGPRSSMAPPTGPRGFAGPYRARGRGGGADFVPRAPRSMAVEDLPRGGGGISDRAPPPSWMDAREDRDRAELGGPLGSAGSGGGSVVHPPPSLSMGGGGGPQGMPRGGYGGRGRGFLPRGGGWGAGGR